MTVDRQSDHLMVLHGNGKPSRRGGHRAPEAANVVRDRSISTPLTIPAELWEFAFKEFFRSITVYHWFQYAGDPASSERDSQNGEEESAESTIIEPVTV